MEQPDFNPDIIHAFRKGDSQAFDTFFRLHYRPLCYFAAQMVGNTPDAEDIAKDAFVKLWHRHADFDSPNTIKGFLYVTTRNACINFLRRLKVKNTFSREFAYLEDSRRDELVLNQLIRAEFMQEIYTEIEKLPEKRREVFKLAYFEGLKNDEIAERLDISVFTVKVHKGKALTSLRLRFSDRHVIFFVLLCVRCFGLINNYS